MNMGLMKQPCPIWGTPSTSGKLVGRSDFLVDSPRVGGEYFVDENCQK